MSEHGSGPASHRSSASRSGPSAPELDYELRAAPRVVDMAPWLIVGCGVGAMIFLFVAATTGLPAARPGAVGAQPGLSPEWPFGPAGGSTAAGAVSGSAPSPPAPSISAASSVPASRVPAPPTRRSPAAPPTQPRRTEPAPRPVDVTGRYRVLASYHDSFIGEVLVANGGQTARQWTVEIRFPENVGRLRTSWVESAPQATLQRSADWYIFTSTSPVAGHSTLPLRFHFDRSGRGETPSECRANGARCTIS